jgi:hypothetical protein
MLVDPGTAGSAIQRAVPLQRTDLNQVGDYKAGAIYAKILVSPVLECALVGLEKRRAVLRGIAFAMPSTN